jgi:hypothetical protein
LVRLFDGNLNGTCNRVWNSNINGNANGHRDSDVLRNWDLNGHLERLFNGDGDRLRDRNFHRVRSGNADRVCNFHGDTLRHGNGNGHFYRDTSDLRHSHGDLDGNLAYNFIRYFHGNIDVSDDFHRNLVGLGNRDHNFNSLLHDNLVRDRHNNFVRSIILDDDLVGSVNCDLNGLRNRHRY